MTRPPSPEQPSVRRVVICCHKPLAGDPRFPDNRPRGGETSVALIREYLANSYRVISPVYRRDEFTQYVRRGDVVLTWGAAADEAISAASLREVPLVLMVRWWRNVCPIPPGDLSSRTLPDSFRMHKQRLFDRAFGVVANNRYTADVVERYYGRKCEVSYVPVFGSIEGAGSSDGPVVLVTDGKQLDGERIVTELAARMPFRRFLVVNANNPEIYRYYSNIIVTPYVSDMSEVWRSAGIMIYPNYRNDVCGTSRVAPEAMRFGVPCLANDRAGICEKGMLSVSRDASVEEWQQKIEDIYAQYHTYSSMMHRVFTDYDTPAQLRVYGDMIDRAFKASA